VVALVRAAGLAPAARRHRCGSYLALELGARLGGGIVECDTPHAVWLPYVEVERVEHATAHGAELRATVLLEPRGGPAGWRSVVATPTGGEIAFSQQKVTA
jgi:hypothetical protein